MFRSFFLLTILQVCTASATLRRRGGAPSNGSAPIERDVCVIGGGSSGTYAAVRITDLNKTVAIVERNDFLGGHAYTYTDPATQAHYDIGVLIFEPLQVVYDYFGRFNIPLLNTSAYVGNAPGQPANTSLPPFFYETFEEDIDFKTGQLVEGIPPFDPGLPAALQGLAYQLSQYPYLLSGWDLPYPVPEDLLLPYGEFLAKYNLTAAIELESSYTLGLGNFLELPMAYVSKIFSLLVIENSSSGFLTTARGFTSELYLDAGDYIGADNIFFESTVVSTDRFDTESGKSEVVITTPTGVQTLSCSQVLLTIPPTTSNLVGWDLTPEESSLFEKFGIGHGYWAGLVTNVGLNYTFSYINKDAADPPYYLPDLPSLYSLRPTGNIADAWNVQFGSPTSGMTDEEVQAAIVTEIQTIQAANNVTVTTPEFLVFQSHSPFQLNVTSDEIADGFYANLTALQGTNDMVYAGAAFHTHDSALLWQYVEDIVLPLIQQ